MKHFVIDPDVLKKTNPQLYRGVQSREYHAALRGQKESDAPWQQDTPFANAMQIIWRVGFQAGKDYLKAHAPRRRDE